MVRSAALLLRDHGLDGTSFQRVLEHAGAPRGSLAHHFPGGKREMIVDAVRWAGDAATDAMRKAVERGDRPTEVVGMMVSFYRRALVDSAFAAGCPVGAVAAVGFDDEPLRAATQSVFADWRALLRDALVAHGRPRRDATEQADLCIAAIEGALMLARVEHSAAPLDRVKRALAPLLD